MAQTAGPAVAGALIKIVGAPLSVVVDAATYLFSAVLVATLRRVPEPPPTSSVRVSARVLGAEISEGARWVYGGSGLHRLAVATHVWFAAQAVLVVVIAPYAYLQLHPSPFQLGLAFAAAGVGALAGATVSTSIGHRLGTGGAIICSYAASSVGVVIMLSAGLLPSVWAAFAVLALGQLCHGWAMGVSNSHEMSYRQALTPDGLQARTNTTMRSLNRAVLVVVSPLAGLAAARFGFGSALITCAAIFVGAAMILVLSPFRRARID